MYQKKLLSYIKFIFSDIKLMASVCIIFTYFGFTADKLMSIAWVGNAAKWSLLFGLFYYVSYNLYLTKQKTKTDQKQKELDLKEEKERKIQLIKSLSSRKKEILRLFVNGKRKQRLTQSREVDEMVKADILEIVSDFIPYRRISKKILIVSVEIKPWALEIIRENQNILD